MTTRRALAMEHNLPEIIRTKAFLSEHERLISDWEDIMDECSEGIQPLLDNHP